MKPTKKSFTERSGKLLSAFLFALLLAPVCSFAQTDNTAALQTQLNAGNVTLSGGTYNVTGLTVTHALNLGGATINMTGASNATIKLSGAGASITNGTIKGTWNSTLTYNASGAMGLRILADNCSITNLHITGFPAYGILVQASNNPTISGNSLDNIGYIGIYYDSEANTTGGTISNNVIDRSAIPPAAVHQPSLAVRGSTSSTFISTGWTISGNTITMPQLPTDWTAEGVELRNLSNSTFTNNVVKGGSIPVSIVRSTGIKSSTNKMGDATHPSQLEGLEFADCNSSSSTGDIIIGSTQVGILLDGSVGCNGIQITNDQVSGTTLECIHTYTNTQNVTISGCTLTASAAGTKAINLHASSNISIVNSTINGNSAAGYAVMVDTCPGPVSITGGAITNFATCALTIYNGQAGLTTQPVTISKATTITGVPKVFNTILANGAAVSTVAVQ